MLWMWMFHDVCTASIKPMQSLGKMRALKYKYFGQVDFMEVLPRLTHFSRLSNCSRKRSPISHQMRIFMRNVFFSTKNKTVLLGNTMNIIYSLIITEGVFPSVAPALPIPCRKENWTTSRSFSDIFKIS